MKLQILSICLAGVMASSCSVFNLPTYTPPATPSTPVVGTPPKEKFVTQKPSKTFLGRDSVMKALGNYQFGECKYTTNGDPEVDFQYDKLEDRLYALKGATAEYMITENGPAVPQFGFRMVAVYPMDSLFYIEDIKKREDSNKNDLGIFWNEKKNQYELFWVDKLKTSHQRVLKMNADKSLSIYNEQKKDKKFISIHCSLKKV